jgi:hypothetical protein
MTARQERIPFLMDTLFTMRQQYPDTELIVSLDPTDDDVVLVEPSGMEPYRFRVSEYRAIEETLQPYHSSAGYRDFIRRYMEWWHCYRVFIGEEERQEKTTRCGGGGLT